MRNKHVDTDQRFSTDTTTELIVVQTNVEDGFGEVAVDLCERLAELVDVHRDKLVCILDAIVRDCRACRKSYR